MSLFHRLPLFLLLSGLGSLAMIAPASFALATEAYKDARSFFYAGVGGLLVTGLCALALSNRRHNRSPLQQLVGLLAAFVFLPVLLAVPFYEAIGTTSFLSAYFEMLSSLTTTGATLYDATRLSSTQHLWRAEVAWIGGLVVWISAASIMAPLALGGFEVTAGGEKGHYGIVSGALRSSSSDPADRLRRSALALAPIYVGLTLVLFLMLMFAGETPLRGLIKAMSVMSTSGILPDAGLEASEAGRIGEIIMAVFLLFALSRMTFSRDTVQLRTDKLRFDPEFRLGLFIIAVVPVALFLRHWFAAFEVGDEQNLIAGLRAFWGALFTATSFLVTAGFVSADWVEAQHWSGLPTPGIILLGLAIFGGGVATTAGGVKLLRVFALYRNGAHELERLVHPHAVASIPRGGRRIRRGGAFIAWVFFMLFALSVAGLTVALGLAGLSFEEAVVVTIAALTNTGPLIGVASAEPIGLAALGLGAKLLICIGMVLGRLELFAIIVMFSPEVWRG